MRPAETLNRLDHAAARLCGIDTQLISSARSNLAEAAPRAREADDVGALAGGLVVVDGVVRPAGRAAYGVDPVLARAVLTVIRFEPEVRAVASLQPLRTLTRHLEAHLREVAVVDAQRAPPGVSTMDWAIAHTSADGVPDAVLVEGEALLIFGGTAEEVADEILILSSHASI